MSTGVSASIRAAQAFVELFLKDNSFRKGLAGVQVRLKAFASTTATLFKGVAKAIGIVGGVGLAGAAGLAALSKFASDYAGSIVDAADRTGVGVVAFQELNFAAEQCGASLEVLETGLKIMEKGFGNGDQSFIDQIHGLGLSFDDLSQMKPEQQFVAIAQAIGKVDDQASKVAAAMGIFGKGGTALLPLFNSGKTGIAGLIAEAHRLGIVVGEEDIKALEAFGDEIEKVFAQAKVFFVKLTAEALPILREIVTGLQDAGIAAIKWVESGQAARSEWVQTFAAIAQGIRSGQFETAFELVTTSIQLLWEKLLDSMDTRWNISVRSWVADLADRLGVNTGFPGVLRRNTESDKRQSTLESRAAELRRQLGRGAVDFDASKPAVAIPSIPPGTTDTMRQHLENAAKAAAAQRVTLAAGSFNPQAAQALGRGGPSINPVVKAIDKGNKHLEDIGRDVKEIAKAKPGVGVI